MILFFLMAQSLYVISFYILMALIYKRHSYMNAFHVLRYTFNSAVNVLLLFMFYSSKHSSIYSMRLITFIFLFLSGHSCCLWPRREGPAIASLSLSAQTLRHIDTALLYHNGQVN